MEWLDVTNIQRGCVYDGGGVRTTLFLKGCPFACPWCCNPETLYTSPQYFIDDQKCLKRQNISSPFCERCERNGGDNPIMDCLFGVCLPTSRVISEKELFNEILKDRSLYRLSGGGITISGGDPILHIPRMKSFFHWISQENISCSIETSLYGKDYEGLLSVITYISEWIVDLKLHKENYKADYMEVAKHNLDLLRKFNRKILYRLVHVESLDPEAVLLSLRELDVSSLELLKCHSLSRSKYIKLGLEFHNHVPDDGKYKEFAEFLSKRGISVVRQIV